MLNETAVDLAIHFLTRRLFTNYSSEFLEERWSCMYVLGGIYAVYKVSGEE